jgi:hypothetical protein
MLEQLVRNCYPHSPMQMQMMRDGGNIWVCYNEGVYIPNDQYPAAFNAPELVLNGRGKTPDAALQDYCERLYHYATEKFIISHVGSKRKPERRTYKLASYSSNGSWYFRQVQVTAGTTTFETKPVY